MEFGDTQRWDEQGLDKYYICFVLDHKVLY